MVGGANSSSTGSGSLGFHVPARLRGNRLLDALRAGFSVPEALAAVVCPTIGGSAAGCSVGGTGNLTLTMTYGSGCSFGSSAATWTGAQLITFSTGTPSCSSFPTGFTGTVQRTFAAVVSGSGSNAPTRVAPSGTSVVIDTSGASAAADGHSYSGGTTVTFASGVRTQIAVNGINYTGVSPSGKTIFSHSMTTSPVGGSSTPLTISNGVVNGTVTTFHNLVKIVATSTLSNVAFTAGCCQPTSGTITTTFAAISGVTPVKTGFVGSTETLTFTGCGTGTYSGPEGYSGAVTLAHCL
jgi:hypothetical protein